MIATPQLNNVEPIVNTPPKVAEYRVQLVTEMAAEIPPKAEAIKPVPVQTNSIQGCEAYRAEVAKYGDWSVAIMMQIMKAESGCRSTAVGDNYPIRGVHAVSCGLFQVRTISGRPNCEALKDPSTNIAWAHKIYLGQGYRAWSVCKTTVRCY